MALREDGRRYYGAAEFVALFDECPGRLVIRVPVHADGRRRPLVNMCLPVSLGLISKVFARRMTLSMPCSSTLLPEPMLI